MATQNQIGLTLSGQSGSVSFAGTTSPTFITPILGAATATTVTFNPTTGGIVGTTTNDSTSAGNVGEFISSNVLIGSAVALTSTITANITSISLTAGDWAVTAEGATAPGSGTTSSVVTFGISQTSATLATGISPVDATQVGFNNIPSNPNQSLILVVPSIRISLASTTTIYFIVRTVFAVSTMSAYGWISARRVR